MRFFATLALIATALPAIAEDRVLSIGGSVTEIVYALGEDDRLVARDTTSQFPPEVEELPDVGYMRALSPEGVLSVEPTLVIAEEGAGPPETISVLEAANIDFVTIPDGYDPEAVTAKIHAVADALGVPEKGEALSAKVAQQIEAARATIAGAESKRVMFILSMQGGRILASGTDTAADGIITLAGAENAVTAYEGYKQLTDEAAIAARPDVILMMDRGGNHASDNADLFAHPGLATTPAATNNAVVRLDGLLLLGFGPRTPDAVRQLGEALDAAG
ncbi:MAG: hemin ABC transporter substrate-binding protein [Pseudomonadota bacterium]